LAKHAHKYQAISASPPCFLHSTLKHRLPAGHPHTDLIPATRAALQATGLPYIIENVEGANLINPILLCGSMFGLGAECEDGQWRQLRRHREFESNIPLIPPGPCRHFGLSLSVHGGGPTRRERSKREGTGSLYTYQGSLDERRAAMHINWLPRKWLNLAIPPPYTKCIGDQLMKYISEQTNLASEPEETHTLRAQPGHHQLT
jgi:DNA (cytosine-5)-methyltransferase 1